MRSLLSAATMVLLGACHSAPPPEPPRNVASAPPAVPSPPVALDLAFAPITGWTRTAAADGVHLHLQGRRADYDLAVRAARPPQGEPLAQWQQLWTDEIAHGQLTTSLSPGPHRARLSSGYPVYWDGGKIQTAEGIDVVAVVYLVVGKEHVLPIVGFYRSRANDDNTLDYDLEETLEPWFAKIQLTGGPATQPLYDATELVGTWTSGSSATEDSAAASETIELRAGGRYVATYRGTSLGTAFTDKTAGTWSVDDTVLALRDPAKQDTRNIWSIGGAPSGARSIRLAPSYASRTNAPLANPRVADRAGWYAAR